MGGAVITVTELERAINALRVREQAGEITAEVRIGLEAGLREAAADRMWRTALDSVERWQGGDQR